MRLTDLELKKLEKKKRVAYKGAALLCGANLPTIDQSLVIVEDQKLIYVGSEQDTTELLEDSFVVDASDYIIHPGLINAHTHAAMSFFRGLAHGQQQMIERLFFPVEKNLQKEWIACLAMPYLLAGLKSGTTMFADHYYFSDAVADTVNKLGMRGAIGETLMDLEGPFAREDSLENAKQLIDSGAYSGRVVPVIAPHASNTCSSKLLKNAAQYAKAHSLPIHLHLAQSSYEEEYILQKHQLTPVQHAANCELLTDNTLAVHLIKANEQDFKTLKDHGSTAVLCASSQMLYEHIADLRLLKKSGVDFAFATDCAASNDGADLWQEARTASLLFKDRKVDLSLDEAIAAISTKPLEALNMHKSLGTIESGKDADLVFVRKDLSCLPIHDLKANLIYSQMSSFVEHVMIEGEWVLFDKKSTRISEKDYMEQLNEVLPKIRKLIP